MVRGRWLVSEVPPPVRMTARALAYKSVTWYHSRFQFDKNVLAAGKSQSGEYFISTRDMNYIDRVIQIEHLGKTYELKWELLFSKG